MPDANAPAPGWRRLLPPTRSRALMLVVILLAAACTRMAISWLRELAESPTAWGAFAAAAWLLLAVGLWRLNRVARWVAIVLIWMIIVVSLTVGILNPDTVGRMMRAPSQAPSVAMVTLRVGTLAAVGVLILHILGKHRAEFGRRRAMPADREPADREPPEGAAS